MMYEKNHGLDNKGTLGAGVLSAFQLRNMNFQLAEMPDDFKDGLILKDSDGDGVLNPARDVIIGGISFTKPKGADGYQVLTPLVSEKPFLSVGTGQYNARAGASIGGAIMQVVFIAGNLPGLYRPTFALLKVPGDMKSGIGSRTTYTIVVEE